MDNIYTVCLICLELTATKQQFKLNALIQNHLIGLTISYAREPENGLWTQHDGRGFMQRECVKCPVNRYEPKSNKITFVSQSANTGLLLNRHGTESSTFLLACCVTWPKSDVLLWPPLSGKAPLPRPGYQMPEPNGCSSYFFGLPVPEGVCFFCLFGTNSERFAWLGNVINTDVKKEELTFLKDFLKVKISVGKRA